MKRIFAFIAAVFLLGLPGAAFASCASTLTTNGQFTTSPVWTGFSDGNGNCLLGAIQVPSASSVIGIVPQVSSSVGSNLVAKASAGNLYGFIGTTGSTAGCFFVFNATSLPANGAVTPALAPIEAAANSTVSLSFGTIPAYFSTGITIGFSSTCGLTLTASTTALMSAQIE